MTGNAADWSKELHAQLEKELTEVVGDFVDLMQTGLDKLVDRSPVRSGQFKANWTVSIGEPDAGVIEARDKDGAETKARGAAVLHGYPVGSFPPVYIQNNVSYASELEHGKSDQAPQGMLALTVVELNALMEARK